MTDRRELLQSLLAEHATRFEFYGPDPEGGAMVFIDRGQTSPEAWQSEGWGIFVLISDTNPHHIFTLCELDKDGSYCWHQLDPPQKGQVREDRSAFDNPDLFEAATVARRISDGVIPLPVVG